MNACGQFSLIIRPLFESFNSCVSSVGSSQDFSRSFLAWLQQYCSLVALRPGMSSPPAPRGSFRGGTTFPSLKYLRTHYGQHCEPFSVQKCTKLQDFAYTDLNTPGPLQVHLVLGPRHQFPLVLLAFTLFELYQTTTHPHHFLTLASHYCFRHM